MSTKRSKTLAAIVTVAAFSSAANAQEPAEQSSVQPQAPGAADYMNHCASCHGSDARGAGPVAQFLTIKVPDLTTLAQSNRGVFPKDRVFSVIDGRMELMIHGPRTMPVWGNSFGEMADEEARSTVRPQGQSVIGRIDDLVDYLASLQS